MRYGLFESKQYCAYLATTKNHVCERYLRVKYKIVQTIRFSLAFFVIIFVRFQIPKYLKPDMEML